MKRGRKTKRRAEPGADEGDSNTDQVVAAAALLPHRRREAKRARRGDDEEDPPFPFVAQGLDEVLCADALAAVCDQVESTADLVRLSCVSRTMRQLVASDSLWRARFRQEHGEAHHDALALALDLHGPAVLKSFFAGDDSAKATKDANAGAWEHGLGVWFEALVATDESLRWRRWMAGVSRATQDEAMRRMESEVRVASQRKRFAARIGEWLEQAEDDLSEQGDEEDQEEDQGEHEQEHDHEPVHEEEEDNDEGVGEDDYACDDNEDDDSERQPPKLETELQRKQVRALLFMTRLYDHFDHRCSDDYRGRFGTTNQGSLVRFLDKGSLWSYATQGGDGQYSVETTKVFFMDPEGQPIDHPQRSLRFSPRGKGRLWEYSVNTARDDNPEISVLPEFLDRLRRQLLFKRAHKKSKRAKRGRGQEGGGGGEGLTLRQFLYFVGVALDLGDQDDDGLGHTPLHALISK